MVQRPVEGQEPSVEGVVQQIPVLLPALVPLPEVAQLVAHEVQLLPRVGEHIEV